MEEFMGNILIVDDDRQFRSMLNRLLREKGHSIQECSDGIYMDEILRNGDIDMVFLDVIMEQKSGMEALIEVRQKYPHVEVVLMSGADSRLADDFFQAAEYWGARGCLQKPFSIEDVYRLVDEVLGSSNG